ncbi:hypothetical protein NW754_008370 [Fusarium falciforme]|uniref:Uncharacterized protein n=1 Tax=Fusarium falciforme TaxID=195108 RepID=A0A9W8RC85_9HYPO|nr:hypothetical protein NW754_008370 [Fusarium falciforme]KAJ4193294.1 hypothetical protein NW755_003291 [Fusarium falciforme]KAJ4193725.1 hypothetical protein NW767_010249 [Fusarium falciforme]KAJ4247959.1 hypothetical protein NW757_008582 [Fusarium falciforme]
MMTMMETPTFRLITLSRVSRKETTSWLRLATTHLRLTVLFSKAEHIWGCPRVLDICPNVGLDGFTLQGPDVLQGTMQETSGGLTAIDLSSNPRSQIRIMASSQGVQHDCPSEDRPGRT